MTTLWKGSITLPEGLPQATLESVELLSNIQGTLQAYNLKTNTENQLFGGADLRVQTVIDASKVPLWLSCGPSLDVQTESQATANVLANIFLEQVPSDRSTAAEFQTEGDEYSPDTNFEYKATQKALLVRIIYDEPPEDAEKPTITELVLYGALTSETPSSAATANTEEEIQQTPSQPSIAPSLSVYALPLSSRLAKEKKLHSEVKQEPLEPGTAKFLVPIIGRKRKVDTIFDEYDKKRAYYASLPPGLRRSWHQRSNSFGSLKDEPENWDVESQKKALSRSIGPSGSDFRKTINEDPGLRRERSQSILTARFREVAERPSTSLGAPPRRDSIAKPSRVASDLGLLRRSDSFASIKTRNQTPDIKSEFGASTNSISAIGTTASKVAERNKQNASKLIMASMRLYGFQRAKAGEVKIESEEEEYKLVYHNTLRSLTFSLRKIWSTDIISVTKLKETTEYLMKVFVGGMGLTVTNSDKEEEEEENPFTKSRINLSQGDPLVGKYSREDTLVGDESFFQDDSQPDISQFFSLTTDNCYNITKGR